MSKLGMDQRSRVLVAWKLDAWVTTGVWSLGLRLPKLGKLVVSSWSPRHRARYRRHAGSPRSKSVLGLRKLGHLLGINREKFLSSMPFKLLSASIPETWCKFPREIGRWRDFSWIKRQRRARLTDTPKKWREQSCLACDLIKVFGPSGRTFSYLLPLTGCSCSNVSSAFSLSGWGSGLLFTCLSLTFAISGP